MYLEICSSTTRYISIIITKVAKNQTLKTELFGRQFDIETIRAADVVVRQRGYCDHFVMMYVCGYVGMCVGVYISTIKRKPLIAMT